MNFTRQLLWVLFLTMAGIGGAAEKPTQEVPGAAQPPAVIMSPCGVPIHLQPAPLVWKKGKLVVRGFLPNTETIISNSKCSYYWDTCFYSLYDVCFRELVEYECGTEERPRTCYMLACV